MESFNISSHSTPAPSSPLNHTHFGEKSENGSVELLPVNKADPEFANPNQPAYRALTITSSASVQKAILPENNRHGDEQPPPERSPSDMENREAPSQTERTSERALLKLSKAVKACLFISGEVGLAATAIRFTSTESLSHNASILLTVSELCCVAGFFLCLFYTLQNTNRNNRGGEAAAGLLGKAGSVVTVCGLVSFMGTQFPEDIMLWLAGAICMILISVLSFMF